MDKPRFSKKEMARICKEHIEAFEELEKQFDEPENRFNSYQSSAFEAMDRIRIFMRQLTGYNVGPLLEHIAEHAYTKAGRTPKYDQDTRELNCRLISMLLARGCSEGQAFKLLARLNGDKAMSSGFQKELRDTFKDYQTADIYKGSWGDDIVDNAWAISKFLDFDTNGTLLGDDDASQKASNAFTHIWQDVIDLMKKYKPILAEYDNAYPDIFAAWVDVVDEDHENPLDYFYDGKKLSPEASYQRKRGLMEYINAIGFFKYSCNK